MNDTSVFDLLAAVLWLVRDLVVPLSLFLAFLGLFNKRDWQNAVMVWILALLGTLATLAGDYKNSLLNLPDALVFLLLLASAILIGVGARKNQFRRNSRGASSRSYSYQKRDDFLSAAEMSFYHVLAQVTGSQAAICPKVGLWDIFYVSDLRKNYGAKSRIDRKHVDFLLCESQTMQPLVAIELDDSSHDRPDRQERDELVDKVFSDADLPLLHIRAQRSYDTSKLKAALTPYIGNGGIKTKPAFEMPPASVQTEEGKPLCPKCGASMVIRVAQQGKYKGQKFYACTNYPKCRGMIPMK